MDLSLTSWLLWSSGLFTVFVGVLYTYLTWNYSYWKKLSVPCEKPTFPFGNIWDNVTQKISILEFYRNVCKHFKGHRYAGILTLRDPTLLVFDPALIKQMFVKDFSHFHDRGIPVDEKNDPMSGHLFNLSGSRWHTLRNKLSPTFTSGKMKYMFPIVKACAEHLQKTASEEMKKFDHSIELKDLMSRYTTDVIGSAAFGVEVGSLENPDSEFRVIGRKVFAPTLGNSIRLIFGLFAPELAIKLGIHANDPSACKFFMKIVKETVAYRDEKKVKRPDFFQLLLGLRNENGEDTTESGLTMNQLAAQCFVFFLGGFETSATTLTFCLYELSRNLDIQQQLREEVDRVLAEDGGEITYDGLAKMHLMDRVICETLRKYPPLPMLARECTKEYTIPGAEEMDTNSNKWKPETRNGGLVVEEGQKVHIPIAGLHYDPEYFPDPERFDPDRFTDEGRKKWPPFAYLPFGEGPRICIGMRFGNMQTKSGLTALLSKYEIRPSPKTPSPFVFDRASFVPTAKGGLWLNIQERHSL